MGQFKMSLEHEKLTRNLLTSEKIDEFNVICPEMNLYFSLREDGIYVERSGVLKCGGHDNKIIINKKFMETFHWDITTIADAIQMAVAPVFLLAGIAGLLAVMTNRLGRVIDRARMLARGERVILEVKEQELINQENSNLLQRGRFINLAIVFAGTSALLVCLVIMVIFTASLLNINVSQLVAVLFIINQFFPVKYED